MEIGAAYVRTSQEKDDAFSLDSQLKAIRAFAREQEIQIPEANEFREEFTGKALDRPKLTELRALIKHKQITAIIIYATDRLARKVGVADLLLDEFMDAGVKLYIYSWGTYVKNTLEDRLRFNFEATFSDFERRKIVERTERGKKDKIGRGLYPGTGQPPYGYRTVGKKRETHLVVEESEAAIIRDIFHWYAVDRMSTHEIVKQLGLLGVTTAGARKGFYRNTRKREDTGWSQGQIYRIIKNRTYIGEMSTHGAIIISPPIVDVDLFNRAQARLEEGRQMSPRSQKYEYLVARLLTCKECGYSAFVHPMYNRRHDLLWRYYRCSSGRPDKVKPSCRLPGFRCDVVDAVVWRFVTDLLTNPASLQVMLEESQKELQEQNADLMYRLTRVEDRIAQQEKRVIALVNEYADTVSQGGDDEASHSMRDIFKRAVNDAKTLLGELIDERDKLSVQLGGMTIGDDFISELTEFAQTIGDDLETLPFAERRRIIEHLGIRGEITLENDEKVIYITFYTHTFRRSVTDSPPSFDAGERCL
jgi:site-specific DNA recombinase